ncbi:MAG: molybdopterin-dependent oxidoreductase [Anaerolineaceae bacterium]|nr:molybdopterin-dependent oxidoreductase [Anaerolineaceae bacterium]
MAETNPLPEHNIPEKIQELAASGDLKEKDFRLQIDRLVEQPLELDLAALAGFPRLSFQDTFHCEEGWSAEDLAWRGIRLTDLLALSRPLPAARAVRIHSAQAEFVVPLSMEQAQKALLCDMLNGERLSLAHGAPFRLVVPGDVCFTSVKWVRRIELAAEAGLNKAERIALGRLPKA